MPAGQVVQQTVDAIGIFDNGRVPNRAIIAFCMADLDAAPQAGKELGTLCNYPQVAILVSPFVPIYALGILRPYWQVSFHQSDIPLHCVVAPRPTPRSATEPALQRRWGKCARCPMESKPDEPSRHRRLVG